MRSMSACAARSSPTRRSRSARSPSAATMMPGWRSGSPIAWSRQASASSKRPPTRSATPRATRHRALTSSVLAIRSVTSTASSWRPLARCTAARASTTAGRRREVVEQGGRVEVAAGGREQLGHQQGDRLTAHRQDRRHPGCDAPRRPRGRARAGGRGGAPTAPDRRRARRSAPGSRPSGRCPAWRRPRKSWATDDRSCAEPARSTSSASRSRASGGHERPLGPAGHGGRLGHREDGFGAPVARRARTARSARRWAGRPTAARPACRAGVGARRSRGPDHRDLPTTPPTSCGHLTAFPRSIGLRAASSSRSGGFRDLVTPMVLKWAKFRSWRSAAVLTACAALGARVLLGRRAGDRSVDHRATTTTSRRAAAPRTPTGASTRSAPSPWPSMTAGGSSSGTRQPLTPPTSPPSPSTSPACSGPTSRR